MNHALPRALGRRRMGGLRDRKGAGPQGGRTQEIRSASQEYWEEPGRQAKRDGEACTLCFFYLCYRAV